MDGAAHALGEDVEDDVDAMLRDGVDQLRVQQDPDVSHTHTRKNTHKKNMVIRQHVRTVPKARRM